MSLKEKLKNKVFDAERRKINRFPYLNKSYNDTVKEKEYSKITKLKEKSLKIPEINKIKCFNIKEPGFKNKKDLSDIFQNKRIKRSKSPINYNRDIEKLKNE